MPRRRPLSWWRVLCARRVLVAVCAHACGACRPEPAGSAAAHPVAVAPDPTDAVNAEPGDRLEVEAPPATDARSTEEPSWFQPLPALVLDGGGPENAEKARVCVATHRLMEPDPKPDDLFAAATCMRAIPMPGREIQIYKVLLAKFPAAAEAKAATRELGARLEQVDLRSAAISAYLEYLRRYPKEADARGLGQRAACLAHSLGDDASARDIVRELERLYARRGFSPPDPATLQRLCRAVPPLELRAAP